MICFAGLFFKNLSLCNIAIVNSGRREGLDSPNISQMVFGAFIEFDIYRSPSNPFARPIKFSNNPCRTY